MGRSEPRQAPTVLSTPDGAARRTNASTSLSALLPGRPPRLSSRPAKPTPSPTDVMRVPRRREVTTTRAWPQQAVNHPPHPRYGARDFVLSCYSANQRSRRHTQVSVSVLAVPGVVPGVSCQLPTVRLSRSQLTAWRPVVETAAGFYTEVTIGDVPRSRLGFGSGLLVVAASTVVDVGSGLPSRHPTRRRHQRLFSAWHHLHRAQPGASARHRHGSPTIDGQSAAPAEPKPRSTDRTLGCRGIGGLLMVGVSARALSMARAR